MMNKSDALVFLATNQPLPDDDGLSEAQATDFDAARKQVEVAPCRISLSLLLGAVGRIEGHGTYQLIEDAFRAAASEDIEIVLSYSLKSDSPAERFWACSIVAGLQIVVLKTAVKKLLFDVNLDVRESAELAISILDGSPLPKWAEYNHDRGPK